MREGEGDFTDLKEQLKYSGLWKKDKRHGPGKIIDLKTGS